MEQTLEIWQAFLIVLAMLAVIVIFEFGVGYLYDLITSRSEKKKEQKEKKKITVPKNDNADDVKKALRVAGEKFETIKSYTTRAVQNIDEVLGMHRDIKNLISLSVKPSAFTNVLEEYSLLKNAVVRNGMDILLICKKAEIADESVILSSDANEIIRENKDSARRIGKFRELITQCTKYAIQRDNDLSDVSVNSLIKTYHTLSTAKDQTL